MTAALDRMAGDLTVPFGRGADTLELPLAPAAGPGDAVVVAYDFGEHRARFGAEPAAGYVLTAVSDVAGALTLTVGYDVPLPGGGTRSGTVDVAIPAGTVAGTSFGVALPPADAGLAVLTTLHADPPPPAVATAWRATALLGNLAKLLWVAGAERDIFDRHVDDVRTRVRVTGTATGATLDLIGYDLGVPRFPPLPYGPEDGTLALYHLDDDAGAPVHDAWPLYLGGGAGHPGTVTAGVQAGAPGRFGAGMRFAVPDAEISVPNAADLSTADAADLTVECFVKPDTGTGDGAVLSKHADPADTNRPGWALSVGEFGRSLPRNVRFRIGDGTTFRDLFADRSLPAARFTHLAAVLDRAAGQVRLVVDGEVTAIATVALGSLANTEPVRIGRAGADVTATFAGTIDEVRLSAAARSAFHPALGEDDDGYRRRLRIFRRWVLPSPDALQEALNDVVGAVAGVPDPFVINDADATLVQSTMVLTVQPVAVPAGVSMDDTGRRGRTEPDVLGTPEDDEFFADGLLVDATDPRADFVLPPAGTPPVPGRPAADPRRMRVGTRAALRALLDALSGAPGRLRIQSGYDPAATDLRATGRALVLTHPAVAPDRLAAQAIRAGFAFVAHRPGAGLAAGTVYAAVRSTDSVEVIGGPGGTATPENGFDLLVGQTVALRLEPAPPPGASVRWSVIRYASGRAAVVGRGDQRDVLLSAERPGEFVAEVQVRDRGRTFSASRRLLAGVAEVPAGGSIAASGLLGSPAPGPLRDDERIHPVYLVDAPARFGRPAGSGPETRRVHPALAARLSALAALLPAGDPELRSAWTPADPGPAAAGRAVTLGPGTSTASLARLGALAYAAGFSYVANDGSRLLLAQDDGPVAPISGPATVNEGGSAVLTVTRAAPVAVVPAAGLLWTVNASTATVSAVDPATGRVLACVKTGLNPVAAAAAPDGSRLVVADSGDTTLTVLTTADRQIAGTVALPAAPADVAYHPDGAHVYAALGSGEVAEVDPVARTVTRVLGLGAPVVAVRCEPGGGRLWAATADGRLRGVPLPAFTAAQTVPLAGPPRGLAVGATRAFVTVPAASALQVIDLAGASVQATLTDSGAAPGAVALAPAGDLLYVVDTAAGRVHLRGGDGTAHPPPGRPASLLLPGATAVAADAGHGYVTSTGDVADTAGVLDSGNGALLSSWPLGAGLGDRLVWSVRVTGGAEAQLSGTTRPRTSVLGLHAGPVQVRAVSQWSDATPPYTLRVDLSESVLDIERGGGRVVLRKDEYDLVMNVLNHLCPIGVEVDTRVIRAHVLELQAALLEAFPPYTYPDFRARGPRPPGWTFGLDQ